MEEVFIENTYSYGSFVLNSDWFKNHNYKKVIEEIVNNKPKISFESFLIILLERRSLSKNNNNSIFLEKVICFVISKFVRDFYHNVRIVSLNGLMFVKFQRLNQTMIKIIKEEFPSKTYKLNYILKRYVASLDPIEYPIDQYPFLLKTIKNFYKTIDFEDFWSNQSENLYGLTNEQIILEHWILVYHHDKKLFLNLIKKMNNNIKVASVHHMLKKLIRYNCTDHKKNIAIIYYKLILNNKFEEFFSEQFMYSDDIKISFISKILSYCDSAMIISMKLQT
jgi:hypothetical protein